MFLPSNFLLLFLWNSKHLRLQIHSKLHHEPRSEVVQDRWLKVSLHL